MFDGFLRHYSEIEVVNVERELKVGWWVFCQFNGDKNDKWSVLFSTTFRFVTRNKRNMVTLALVASTSLLINTNSLFYVDKVIFFFTRHTFFFGGIRQFTWWVKLRRKYGKSCQGRNIQTTDLPRWKIGFQAKSNSYISYVHMISIWIHYFPY